MNVAGKPLRRLRYGLRSLFIALTLFTVAFGLWVNSARCQRLAVEALRRLDPDGQIYYDYQETAEGPDPAAVSRIPPLLHSALGVDFFHTVDEVHLSKSSDDALAHVGRLRSVRFVWIDTPTVDTIRGLSHLANLTNLEGIELGTTILVSGFFGPPPNTGPLTIRPFEQTEVAGPQLADMPIMPWLKGLSSHVINTDQAAVQVAKCQRLEHFSTYSDSFTDEGLRRLATLTRLKHLEIAGPGVTDAGLDAILGLQNLEYLDLATAKVTVAGLSKLQSLPKLKDLWVPDRFKDDLPAIRAALPNCTVSTR